MNMSGWPGVCLPCHAAPLHRAARPRSAKLQRAARQALPPGGPAPTRLCALAAPAFAALPCSTALCFAICLCWVCADAGIPGHYCQAGS